MKIVFGGTFDPVHNGHLRVATELSELFDDGEVALMPCKLPVHKAQSSLSQQQRLVLLDAAVADSHCLTVDDRELQRTSESYTYTTLAELAETESNVVFSVGTDAALNMRTWYKSERLAGLCNLVVLKRPGYVESELTNVLKDLGFELVTTAEGLLSCASGGALLVSVTQLDISSSDIRNRIRRGKSVRYLVPDAVHQIICDNHLFKESSTVR